MEKRIRMDFDVKKCPYCGSDLEIDEDQEDKRCNKCKIEWNFRDDDDSWRSWSIATEDDLWEELLKNMDTSSIEDLKKKYLLKYK